MNQISPNKFTNWASRNDLYYCVAEIVNRVIRMTETVVMGQCYGTISQSLLNHKWATVVTIKDVQQKQLSLIPLS